MAQTHLHLWLNSSAIVCVTETGCCRGLPHCNVCSPDMFSVPKLSLMLLLCHKYTTGVRFFPRIDFIFHHVSVCLVTVDIVHSFIHSLSQLLSLNEDLTVYSFTSPSSCLLYSPPQQGRSTLILIATTARPKTQVFSKSENLCVWTVVVLRTAHRVKCDPSPCRSTDGLQHKEVWCNYHSPSLHFCSWLNMGEVNQTISMLSGRSLTAGVFHSVRDKVLACTTRASWLATVN